MTEKLKEIWLVRHGETEWSISGAHTGRTDIPLTQRGQERAESIRKYLNKRMFDRVLVSPRLRAKETCRIAGYGDMAIVNDNLCEWDYGIYEGKKTIEIRQEIPDWSIWTHPIPDGESIHQVAARARAIIKIAQETGGSIALFSHGHFLRIFVATWLGLPPEIGKHFVLSTGSVSVLGFEREEHVVVSWNRALENE